VINQNKRLITEINVLRKDRVNLMQTSSKLSARIEEAAQKEAQICSNLERMGRLTRNQYFANYDCQSRRSRRSSC
jgi:hypothetical protein